MERWKEVLSKYRHERCPDGYGVLYRFKRKTGSRKAYIGISGDFPKRFKAHVYGKCDRNRSESAIHNAINKYGIDGFDVDILDFLPDEELSRAEYEEIAFQKTMAPGGYNLEEGGSRAHATEDTRRKRSEAMKRTIASKSAAEIGAWRAKGSLARSSQEFKNVMRNHKSFWWKTVDQATRDELVERATASRNAGHAKRLQALRMSALPYEPIRAKRVHGQLYIRQDGKVARANPKLILIVVHPRLQA